MIMLGHRSIKVKGADCGFDSIFLAVITSFGGFLFGYDVGLISGIQLFHDFESRFLPDSDTNTTWRPIIKSMLVSFMSVGCLAGSLLGAYTSERLGRRKSVSLGVVFFIIGGVIQITAINHWAHVTVGRIVSGLGIGNLSVGIPMFQSECAPREIRGAVVASYQLMITLGILAGNILCYQMRAFQDSTASWRIIIGIGIFIAIPLGVGVLLVPESPRWLAGRDDWVRARLSLSRLRGKVHDPGCMIVDNDVHEMKEVLHLERLTGRATWLECFSKGYKVPKTLYRTLLGMGIHFLQQWSGINYFFYYGASIFQSAQMQDPMLNQLILGAVNVGTTFLAVYLVDRFGRRWPLIIGALWQAFWLLVFATVGELRSRIDAGVFGIVMITAACMFIASFAATWGPVPWVVLGETFALRTRAKQASLATATNWFGNFLMAFFTPFVDSTISFAFGFVLVAANLVAALLVWYFLYESCTLSLENVDLMYSMDDLKPWNSANWVPPGYETRLKRAEEHYRRMSISASSISEVTQEIVDKANENVIGKPKEDMAV